MKTFTKILMILVILGMVSTAGAVPVTTVDTIDFGWTDYATVPQDALVGWGGDHVRVLEYVGDYVDYTHDLDFGFLEIYSASLSIYFFDDDSDDWDKDENASLSYDTGTFDIGEVSTGWFDVGPVDIADLLDGSLLVNLMSYDDDSDSDFRIYSSELTVDFEPIPNPEPATILLLGAGIFGLVGFRKYKKK